MGDVVRMRRSRVSSWLRSVAPGAGLMVLGAGIGMSLFIIVDSLQPEDKQTREGVMSFRGPYYATCREAFLDGRANIRRGEPGYRAALDADGDGLACEPYVPMR